MKKAKILLTLTAILAVVGSALAYKASFTHLFYSTGPEGNCNVILFTKLQLTTTLWGGGFTTELSTTKDNNNPCPGMSVRVVA